MANNGAVKAEIEDLRQILTPGVRAGHQGKNEHLGAVVPPAKVSGVALISRNRAAVSTR